MKNEIIEDKNLNECTYSNCKFEIFNNPYNSDNLCDKCIFHCEKDDWYKEVNDKKIWNKEELVKKFWEEFKEHKPTIAINQTIFSEYIFPTSKLNHSTDGVFSIEGIFSVLDNNFVSKLKSLSFSKCIFLGDFKIINIEKEPNITLDFNEVTFKDIFKLTSLNINKLSFNYCKFENEFHIKNTNIKNTNIKILKFSKTTHLKDSKLYIKSSNLDKFEIDDIDLSRSSDSIFQISNLIINEEFKIKETNLAYLEINGLNISNSNSKILFENVSFQNTILNNIKWGDNIFKIQADRDIFRQLKLANDSQANYIIANKFFVMEMKKYKTELKEKSWFSSDWQEKLIFLFNEKISNFSQSWFLPLIWLIIIPMIFLLIMFNKFNLAIVTYLGVGLFFGYLFDTLKKELKLKENCIYTKINYTYLLIEVIIIFLFFHSFGLIDGLNIFAKFMFPKMDEMFKGCEFLWSLHKIISGFIIYHFIIALRRQTKR